MIGVVFRYEKKFTLEFTRDRKSMSTYVVEKGDKPKLLVKGAPENVLARCATVRVGGKTVKLTDKMRETIMQRVTEYVHPTCRKESCVLICSARLQIRDRSPDIAMSCDGGG